MKNIQATKAKAQFSEILDEVERGGTVIITRHGKPIVRMTPMAEDRQSEIRDVIAKMKQLRLGTKGVTVEEILQWRDEGRR
jgi:prevent-host-death family protein